MVRGVGEFLILNAETRGLGDSEIPIDALRLLRTGGDAVLQSYISKVFSVSSLSSVVKNIAFVVKNIAFYSNRPFPQN